MSARVACLLLILLTSCGRKLGGASAPQARIVSLGGAVTEVVFALGAGDRVVGVDTSSTFPSSTLNLPKVGYQRTLIAEGVLALSPTLLLASSEAGPETALEQLKAAGVRVHTVPATPSLQGARSRILVLAQLLGRDPAPTLAALDADLLRAQQFVATTRARPKVLALYARGGGTLLVFGKNTAAAAMIALAGADNAVIDFDGTKPFTSEAIVAAAPSIILLPSRGLESLGGIDGLLSLPGVAQTPAGASKRVVAIDDLELLGFGPRTGKAVLELALALHAADQAAAVPITSQVAL